MSDDVLGGLKFEIDTVGSDAVVAVSGALDAQSAVLLAGVLHAVIDAGCGRLIIDCGEVTFIDDAVLDVVVGVSRLLVEAGGFLTLRSPSEQVRTALDADRARELVMDVAASAPELHSTFARDDASRSGGASRETDLAAQGVNVRPRSSTATVDAALRLVTALAATTVDNAEGVSVTLERHGRVMTVAASDDEVKEMDAHQYDTGEGPCLAARAEGRPFYIESLAEETRWPKFVPLALEQGIHSILSSPLMTKDRPQGALNMYSSTERAFGARQQELAALFAEQASKILTTAEPEQTDEQINKRLAAALSARQVIHQAQGVIMERQGLSAASAAGALHRAARAEGRTVAEYATEVIEAVGRADGQP